MKKESPCRTGHSETNHRKGEAPPPASGTASTRPSAPASLRRDEPTSAEKRISLPNPLCFTRFEFADAFRVSVRTVDRMIAAGEIQVRRIRGKSVRIPRSEVERYLDGGSATRNGDTKNLNTNNQTGALAPETNKTKTKK